MAGSSGSIRAGRAYVEIFADKSALMRGLKSAEDSLKRWGQSVQSFGKKMIGAGSAIIAPLIGAATKAAHLGHEFEKMSEITGASTDSIQSLAFAADQSGIQIESVTKALIFMHKNMFALANGSKQATSAFGKLGLSASDLKGLAPEDQFMLIADRLASIENPTERAALALKVFGRSGASLLPLINQGKGAMAAYRAELERLGISMSHDDIQAAAGFYKELKKLWYVIKNGLTTAIGSALIPMLKDFASKTIEVIAAATRWIKANRGVVDMG